MSFKTNLHRRFAAASLLVALSIIFVGCPSVHTINQRLDTTIGAKHKVENVHQVGTLPLHLKRVALLPAYKGKYDHIEMESIEQSFVAELNKQQIFEVVAVTPATMEELFRRPRFSSIENLPTKLLSKLHQVYAIDGIMLVDVSYFNAYQPVGLGVRAKLLDGHTGEIVWAADELFDSSNPAVANAARQFYKSQSLLQYPLHNTQTVVNSPTRFSKYVANAIFNTISLQKN